MASLPTGELFIGGRFETVGGLVSPFLVSLVAPCPATAVPFGSGCVGSNGLAQLFVDDLPWLGSTRRSRATRLPAISLVATVTGFAPLALPLDVLWQEAGAGCLGHTTAGHVRLALPVAGVVASQIAVPSTAALIGLQLHQHALALEFDAAAALLAVTSTNGVTVGVGRF